jgi:hypothetical protein
MRLPNPPQNRWPVEVWVQVAVLLMLFIVTVIEFTADLLSYFSGPVQFCQDCGAKAWRRVTWFDVDVKCHSFNLCRRCSDVQLNSLSEERGDSPPLVGAPSPDADNPFASCDCLEFIMD